MGSHGTVARVDNSAYVAELRGNIAILPPCKSSFYIASRVTISETIKNGIPVC